MEYFHNGCGIIPQYRPGCGSIRSQGGKRRGQTEVTARPGSPHPAKEPPGTVRCGTRKKEQGGTLQDKQATRHRPGAAGGTAAPAKESPARQTGRAVNRPTHTGFPAGGIPAPASRLFRMPGGPGLPQPRPSGGGSKKRPGKGSFQTVRIPSKKGLCAPFGGYLRRLPSSAIWRVFACPEGSNPPPSRFSPSPGNRIPMGWAKIKRAPPV